MEGEFQGEPEIIPLVVEVVVAVKARQGECVEEPVNDACWLRAEVLQDFWFSCPGHREFQHSIVSSKRSNSLVCSYPVFYTDSV